MQVNVKSQIESWSYKLKMVIKPVGYRLSINGNRMFNDLINGLIHKYVSSLFALLSFLVEDPSAISAASAIVSCSSLVDTIILDRASPFRTRACAAVVNECNQIIQAAHRLHPRKTIIWTAFFKMMKKRGGIFHIYDLTIYTTYFFFKY